MYPRYIENRLTFGFILFLILGLVYFLIKIFHMKAFTYLRVSNRNQGKEASTYFQVISYVPLSP
jgi:hypothetical protein